MPRQETQAEYQQIWAHGPRAEFVPAAMIAAVLAASPIAISGTFTSPPFPADGFYDWSIGITLSQAGTINLLRFIDDAGTTLLSTSPPTAALTAATAAVLTVTDGMPYASYKIQIINGSGSAAANITNFAALQAAH